MKDGIRLVCSGNATPASSLVPKAIAMVDRLREVDEFGYQQWQVSDTQRIDVKLNGTHATIWIWEDESESAEACPLYVSGMTWEGVRIKRSDPETGQTVRATRWFQPSQAYRSRAQLAAGWQTIDAMKVEPNPIATIPFFTPPDGPTSWRQEGWAQIATLHACSYSGAMRQVVQVLLGMDAVVPYRYDFACTHGVWVNSADGKRRDWLIEISKARGVLAMPLPSCTSTTPPDSVLGYTPKGQTFPDGADLADAIKAGDVRQLMPADGLVDFYSKGGLFSRCGWAYSLSGRKACNIVTSPDRLTLNGVVCELPRMSLFVIEISPNDKGEPAGASISMVESGIAIGGGGNGAQKGQIRYPADDTISITFSPSLPHESLADYANANAPLYCWYDGEDMQVVRIKTTPKTTSRPPDENPKPRYPGNNPYPGPDYPMLSDIYWFLNGSQNLGKTFVEYPKVAFSDQRENRSMSSPVFKTAKDFEYAGERRTYYAEATGFTIIDTGSRDYPYINTYKPRAVARVTGTYSRGATKTHYDCVVVPPVEREGVVHYRYVVEFEPGPISSRIDAYEVSYRTGIYEAPSSTAWGTSPLIVDYQLKQEYSTPPPYSAAWMYDLSGFGTIFKTSEAAYGGSYQDTKIPPSFIHVAGPGGTDTDSTEEVMLKLANLMPVRGTENSPLPKKTVTAQAKFAGTGGVLVEIALDATDKDQFSVDNKWTLKNPQADGTLHSFMCIRSAEGRRYHISPNIDAYGWECSNFGAYQAPPDKTKNWSINFVGDA